MDYGMIGKIEKARRYAEEPQRITLHTLEVEFRGDNDTYIINLTDAGWHCSCAGFAAHGLCPHVMTLEKVFKAMLKRPAMPYGHGQNVVSDVEKSTRYSHEKDRILVRAFTATFEGSNDSHELSYNQGAWTCSCDFFHSRHVCCHTMALERILVGMIPAPVTAVTT